MWTTLGSSTLFYTRDGSNKFYEVEVQIDDAFRPNHGTPRFRVRARYGRRGADATWAVKDTSQGLDRAIAVAAGVLQGKYRKGYTAHINGFTPVNNIDSFRSECWTRFSNEHDQRAPRLSQVDAARARQRGIVQEPQSEPDQESERIREEANARAREQRLALQAERDRQRREKLREQALQHPEYEDFLPRVIDFDGVD